MFSKTKPGSDEYDDAERYHIKLIKAVLRQVDEDSEYEDYPGQAEKLRTPFRIKLVNMNQF